MDKGLVAVQDSVLWFDPGHILGAFQESFLPSSGNGTGGGGEGESED